VVKHDRRCAETGNREAAAWGGERGAWKAMLTELNADRGRPSELLWPTAYAHIVLFGALCEAAARVTPPRSTADVPSLTEALQTATGCLATWLAFAAVDTGGLPNPAL
jgi:hypothetical protein